MPQFDHTSRKKALVVSGNFYEDTPLLHCLDDAATIAKTLRCHHYCNN